MHPLIARNRDEFSASLTEKQTEALEKFEDCMNEMHGVTARRLLRWIPLGRSVDSRGIPSAHWRGGKYLKYTRSLPTPSEIFQRLKMRR